MSYVADLTEYGVFQVFTGAGTGSGFLISPNTLVTNCHVVSPFRTVAVELRDKQRILGHVRRIHPRRDLAIVELARPVTEKVFQLAESAGLKAKQPINIVGFPIGLPLSITEGVISNPHQLLDGQHFVQTDAAINPGNSGGPILDQEKNVIAVTTCKLRAAESVGFGIPASDVLAFCSEFNADPVPFAVTCPACEATLTKLVRYCDNCGTDLEPYDLASYFEPPALHPVSAFVERALTQASVDPILARHGDLNWSFYHGSAPIKIWSCCSEHLCFASPLAKPGKKNLGELFRFLLAADHAPYAFDIEDHVIRLNLTVHMSDVFAERDHTMIGAQIAELLRKADAYDNMLIEQYGCEPAPDTHLTFLKSGGK